MSTELEWKVAERIAEILERYGYCRSEDAEIRSCLLAARAALEIVRAHESLPCGCIPARFAVDCQVHGPHVFGMLSNPFLSEDVESYTSLLGRIEYSAEGLRRNLHFMQAYNQTRLSLGNPWLEELLC